MHKQTYGAPRVHAYLTQHDKMAVSRYCVAKLMRELRYVGRRGQKAKRKKYPPASAAMDFPNLLNRRFTPGALGDAWVSDLTQWQGRYLCVVLELATREVIAYRIGPRSSALVCATIRDAMASHHYQPGTIFHSDRGSEYTASDTQWLLASQGFTQSWSRPGNCHDNAVSESFFATCKLELTCGDERSFPERLARYIHYYNHSRLHSTLRYTPPAKHRQRLTFASHNVT